MGSPPRRLLNGQETVEPLKESSAIDDAPIKVPVVVLDVPFDSKKLCDDDEDDVTQAILPANTELSCPVDEPPRLTFATQLGISLYAMGQQCVWGSLNGVFLPREVQTLVGEIRKGPALGLVSGSGALFAVMIPLIFGGLSDRCTLRLGRRRPFLASGGVIGIVGLILMCLAAHNASLWGYTTAYLLVVFGMNISGTAYNGVLPDFVPISQRGAVSGLMGSVTQLGTISGIVIGGLLLGINRAAAYGAVCGIMAVCLACTCGALRETPLKAAPPMLSVCKYFKSLWISPSKHPNFTFVWTSRFLVMMGFHGTQPYFMYYLREVINVADPVKATAALGGVVCTMATISAVLAGILSDRIGLKPCVIASNLLISLAGFAFIFTRSIASVLVVGAIFGSGIGAYMSCDWALGTRVLPSNTNAAKEMAVWHIAVTFPQAIAGPVCGFMLASYGVTIVEGIPRYAFAGYATVLGYAAVVTAIGAALVSGVKGIQ